MGAAVLMIYAVMVLLFSGFVHPLTIMVASAAFDRWRRHGSAW
jgi:multidrug efflux pump subunit AcrB